MTAATPVSLEGLRRYAVARAFFPPTTIERAVEAFGFVQADPIRAPARAQDLTLRHRVAGYRAGDLERLYPTLAIEEDFFVNYGFMPRAVQGLMHPRSAMARWSPQRRTRAEALLAFVRERGTVHPREVDAYFAHGTVTNYWGGASSATTHLLDGMHYRGMLRIARRDGGIRVYAVRELPIEKLDGAARRARVDALVDVIVATYAPLPKSSLSWLVRRLQLAVPQSRADLTRALQRATARL
ncbi:MAG: crosslink repair DNA glycosylase YcaQ family protein, partial [Vicinamibacterales bacterium]